eukprot:2500937-Rhodomonas_salina.5
MEVELFDPDEVRDKVLRVDADVSASALTSAFVLCVRWRLTSETSQPHRNRKERRRRGKEGGGEEGET